MYLSLWWSFLSVAHTRMMYCLYTVYTCKTDVKHIPGVRTGSTFSSATTRHFQVGILGSSNFKHWLLSTWSIPWQRHPNIVYHSPLHISLSPHIPSRIRFYLFSLFLKEVRAPSVCDDTAHVNCAGCDSCLREPVTPRSESTLFAGACSVMLRVYSPWAWFVEGRPHPISCRVLMTRNRTLSPHNLCRNPFCDVHVRARKDEEEGVLREGILGSSLQFVRAVGEKLFSEKLFSKPCCLREAVLEKPFSAKLFYASQPRSCSCRSRSTRRVSASPYPEGATPTLSTRIENQNHADWVWQRTDNHN